MARTKKAKEVETIVEKRTEATMPEDIQLMIDSGIPNKTILTTIVEANGKTYGEFIKAHRDIMNESFLTLAISAKQF